MSGSVPARATSPVMVGRDSESARIDHMLEALAGGQAGLVIISGEAGIGKTRLIDEALTRAAGKVRVLRAECLALGSGIPYLPFAELLRDLARQLPAHRLTHLLGPAREELARFVPEMALAVDGAAQAADRRVPHLRTDELERLRLYEAFLRVVERVAADQPTVFVVEDVQWIDRASLELLAFLAHGVRQRDGAALVVSVRPEEIEDKEHVLTLMAELGRGGSAERIELGPLSGGSTERVAAAILGEAPGAELIAHVQALSDGNPLYAEELLSAWARLGPEAPLPPKLRDLLAARLAQVPMHVLEVLRVAAAAGRRVDDRLLTRASGLSVERVQQAVRAAVDDSILIRSEGPERPGYRFRHEILRSVVAAQLLPAEAQAIHAAYARALEEEPAERRNAAELASHWDAAGDAERAMTAHVKAGHAVAATFAFEQASHHLERALELWTQVSDPATLSGATREEVTVAAAGAAARAGDFGRAIGHMRTLVTHRGALPEEAWQLARSSLRWYLWEAGELEAALEQAELVIAEDGTPARWRANALGHASGLLLYLQRTAEAAEQARAAKELADASGAQEERILAEGLLGWCQLLEGETDNGLAGIRRAVEDARATESSDGSGRYPAGSALAHSQLATALELVGRLEETYQTAVDGVTVAARQGVSRTFGSLLEASAARAQYQLGHWQDAATRVDRALEGGAVGGGRILLLALRASLEVGRGRQPEAAATITLAESLIGASTSLDIRRWLTAPAVERALWLGDASEALTRLAFVVGDGGIAGVATPGASPTMLDASIPVLLTLGARAWADLALAERFGGSEPGLSALARAQLDDALGRAAKRRALADAWSADLALARAELARGEDLPVTERIGRWRTAHEGLAGRPYARAYAAWRLAESLLARRDGREPAAPVLAEALEVARALGAAPLIEELSSLAHRARLDLAADGRAGPGAHDGDAGRAFGLTDRETEVLILLATGLSNQEIAEQLFISPKTASVHVSNIYGKLGVESRVAAATLAHQLGLDRPAEEPSA